MDPTSILVGNLVEALRQVTTYLTLGLTTAVSALVIDRRSPEAVGSPPVTLLGVAIPMAPETGKWLLLGLSWVAGALASYAVEAAARIVGLLHDKPDVLLATCTYPSLATAPVGVGVIAAALPAAFVLPVMWRMWKLVRQLDSRESIAPLFVFLIPYGALAVGLVRLQCRT